MSWPQRNASDDLHRQDIGLSTKLSTRGLHGNGDAAEIPR